MDYEMKLTIAPIEQIAVGITNVQTTAQEMIASFQASFDQVSAGVRLMHENMRRTAERWIEQEQNSIRLMVEMTAAAAASFERYRNEEEPEACRLLSQAGWLGMDHHFSIHQLRESVLRHKSEGEASMNEAILAYFNGDDFALMEAMTEHWLGIPYLRDREKIIRDAVYAHKHGLFTLSIPALLPLVEGLSAEILGTATTKAVSLLAEDRMANDPELWMQGFRDFVEQVLCKGYEFGKDPAPYLNRHGILHGRVFDYPSALNSTRVFLLIDAVAELWREKQKTVAPAMIQ